MDSRETWINQHFVRSLVWSYAIHVNESKVKMSPSDVRLLPQSNPEVDCIGKDLSNFRGNFLPQRLCVYSCQHSTEIPASSEGLAPGDFILFILNMKTTTPYWMKTVTAT